MNQGIKPEYRDVIVFPTGVGVKHTRTQMELKWILTNRAERNINLLSHLPMEVEGAFRPPNKRSLLFGDPFCVAAGKVSPQSLGIKVVCGNPTIDPASFLQHDDTIMILNPNVSPDAFRFRSMVVFEQFEFNPWFASIIGRAQGNLSARRGSIKLSPCRSPFEMTCQNHFSFERNETRSTGLFAGPERWLLTFLAR